SSTYASMSSPQCGHCTSMSAGEQALEVDASVRERLALDPAELRDTFEGEIDHGVDVGAGDGFALRRALQLDHRALGSGDHVEVHAGGAVLGVVQVERVAAV